MKIFLYILFSIVLLSSCMKKEFDTDVIDVSISDKDIQFSYAGEIGSNGEVAIYAITENDLSRYAFEAHRKTFALNNVPYRIYNVLSYDKNNNKLITQVLVNVYDCKVYVSKAEYFKQ